MSRLLLVVWLTVVWCALWGEASVGNILAGLAISAVLVLAFLAWVALEVLLFL